MKHVDARVQRGAESWEAFMMGFKTKKTLNAIHQFLKAFKALFYFCHIQGFLMPMGTLENQQHSINDMLIIVHI